MSIDISRHKRLRSERTLIRCSGWGALRGTGPRTTGPGVRFFSVPCEGQALALRGSGRFFFVVRGSVRRDRALILSILSILAILLQTRAIKVLMDLFCLLLRWHL